MCPKLLNTFHASSSGTSPELCYHRRGRGTLLSSPLCWQVWLLLPTSLGCQFRSPPAPLYNSFCTHEACSTCLPLNLLISKLKHENFFSFMLLFSRSKGSAADSSVGPNLPWSPDHQHLHGGRPQCSKPGNSKLPTPAFLLISRVHWAQVCAWPLSQQISVSSAT